MRLMAIPARRGIDEDQYFRKVAPLERERDKQLRQLAEPTDSGGVACIWYCGTVYRLRSGKLIIQPGIGDDLSSFLSSLAVEIAWPGAPASDVAASAPPPAPPEQAIAAWARIWQVREQADMRVLLWWDARAQVHGAVELQTPAGGKRPLLDTPALIAELERVAVQPQSSASPHGLLLAGNRAMRAGDYVAAHNDYARAQQDLPHHHELRHNLGLALAHLGQWEEAAQQMQQSISLDPGDQAVQTEYLALETDAGIDAVRRQDLTCAAEHFLRILSLQPAEPTALANLGNLRLREGRLPEARAIFLRFLRFHPTHPAAAQIRLALEEIGGTSEQ